MADPGSTEPCEDFSVLCLVGRALRAGVDPQLVLAQALDERLYRGVRPSMKPLARTEAIAEVLEENCARHEALAATLLAVIGRPDFA